ncbi:hypothetical protein [Salinimicrobium sp. GXAS 041]|uniref:hypothetical protein n=1 Tax=Salinimicrobium sp. GXAS 041 TaxID=3400806 RepID=UPI003C71E00A
MMKTLTTFALCFFILSSAVAQIGSSGNGALKNRNDNEEIMNEFFKGVRRNSDAIDAYDGTPYLYKEFKRGVLQFPDHEPLAAQIRYDVAKEEMQIKFDEESFRVLHDGIPVQIEGDLYKKFTYRGEEKHIDLLGYFRVITPEAGKGDLLLLEKPYKKVKRGKAAAAMQKAKPPRYVDKSDFYLRLPDSNLAVKADKKLKNFLKVFPADEQDALKSFIKENKLKPKKEEDLKQIVQYYNTAINV